MLITMGIVNCLILILRKTRVLDNPSTGGFEIPEKDSGIKRAL